MSAPQLPPARDSIIASMPPDMPVAWRKWFEDATRELERLASVTADHETRIEALEP